MIELNPFDDLIVNDPRRAEPAVSGLNHRPLETLVALFDHLAAGEIPRAQRQLPQAQLVTSVEPGYGKSHLINRLFRRLNCRGTLIYIRPFQNSALGFQSVLAAVVRESSFPDRAASGAWDPADPTQLDALGFSVLSHCVADLHERRGGDPAAVERLRKNPLAAFTQGPEADSWWEGMCEGFERNCADYEQALALRGIELHSRGWLRVLFAYAFHPDDREVRQAALEWIAGQPLSREDAELLHLPAGQRLHAEASAEELNETARTRLSDLTRLAAYHRPFVFCFDQTEAYGHSEVLARSFGMVIATLVNEAVNHLTLVTSNQSPWTRTIEPHFEDADRQRIAHPPVTLEGLKRSQGEELIRLRMNNGNRAEMLERMLQPQWLADIFPNAERELPARRFLQHCKERWHELRQQPLPPALTLAELYESRRASLLAEPKRLVFDADALQWLVKICARDLPETKVHSSAKGYFPIGWETPALRVLFGFEPGSNWKRWQAITREASQRAAKNPPLKVLMFRAADQPPIPGRWQIAPEIEHAKAHHLDLLALSREDFATLYAGYDLYAEALAGDIPHSPEDVLEFARARFAQWWERLTVPIAAVPPPPAALPPRSVKEERKLVAEVRAIVATEKFLSIDETVERLTSPATRDEVLKACGYCPEIRLHSHPQMVVLQWQAR